ncbi:beta-lactamase hydrolase domain-containing protein [Rhizobium sp. L1K21]|uniref:beta-lactamase hydrolase domain-containing protein n=1 Tax=Rhizobium sp. L1K21 TaxID=2954933 RepID=UPI0020930941|nr:sulfur transferase domain-containing protein [Rhizobium sp. L1K21]MCO6187296.1 sulfur transferase domain-containing protein [Rhizobium sp. L1K21]
MSVRQVDTNYFVAGQIKPENIEILVRNGFTTVVCTRPDGEGFGQPRFSEIEAAAKAGGIEAYYLPVGGGLPPEHVKQMKSIMANAKGKVLGYCASGNRATMLYQMAR